MLAPARTHVVQRRACEPRYAGRYGLRDSGPGPRRTALVVQAAQAHNIDNQLYLVVAKCSYLEALTRGRE